MTSWIYLTLVEQMMLLISVLFLASYTFTPDQSFHSLELNIAKFVIVLAIFMLASGYGTFLNWHLVSCFILLTSFLILLFWEMNWWAAYWQSKTEVEILFLLNLASTLLFVGGVDLVVYYLLLEIQSLMVYTIMVLFSVKEVSASVESVLKYFMLGGLASSGLLLGSAILYSLTGTTNLNAMECISSSFHYSGLMQSAVTLILVTSFFKLGMAPFHFWSVDVCQSSPMFLLLLILTLRKTPMFSVITSLGLVMSGLGLNFLSYGLIFVVASLMVGAYGGYQQFSINSLMAYSSTSNMGLMVSGFLLAMPNSMAISWSYVYIYSLMTILTVGGLSLLLKFNTVKINSLGFSSSLNLLDLKGLDYHNSIGVIGLGLLLFSLVGVPPLVGFFMKLNLLTSLFSYGLHLLALSVLFISVLNALVYLSIVKGVYVSL